MNYAYELYDLKIAITSSAWNNKQRERASMKKGNVKINQTKAPYESTIAHDYS